jgi:2-oxo-4-hydroxy-4-carboxy-5-ureidoimidazoline decarboxylase
MNRDAFLARYGAVFDHSPWVAERAYGLPGEDFLPRALAAIAQASDEDQKSLIRAHPELAAKISLTESSAAEQQGAGLRHLSEAEFAMFSDLNKAYREKFGFPFVICVREHSKASILAAMRTRLQNDPAAEQRTALTEIGKIAKYRLEALS